MENFCEKLSKDISGIRTNMKIFDIFVKPESIASALRIKVGVEREIAKMREECYEHNPYIFWNKYRNGETVFRCDDQSSCSYDEYKHCWYPHPEGIMFEDDKVWQILLNGKVIADFSAMKPSDIPDKYGMVEEKVFDVRPHPRGYIVHVGDKLFINDQEVYHEPNHQVHFIWKAHPKGFVIQRSREFWLNDEEKILEIPNQNPFFPEPTNSTWISGWEVGRDGEIYFEFFHMQKEEPKEWRNFRIMKTFYSKGISEIVFEGEGMCEVALHPDGGLIAFDEANGRVVLNQEKVLFKKEGLKEMSDVMPCPGGVIVLSDDSKWTFYNGEDLPENQPKEKRFWHKLQKPKAKMKISGFRS
ncbi:MAG: hypothetical protein NTW50_05300 [Candidatus Berkelbacteria bacterium]|nr:hypothetical protein [Candidatus Berkelbacteria bacterium]